VRELILHGCTATPFGSYLKALGVLRLVTEQADPKARGRWASETFSLETELTADEVTAFFVEQYAPTPILAPWNGGSGFYPKDNKTGIDAISKSTDGRFEVYRDSIAICRDIDEVRAGKSDDEDTRRTAILRHCRNRLNDGAVEWLDAAVGIAADGSRSFAPVLGTGGNEGRLDYTNNFMLRIAALLIDSKNRLPVTDLLKNALFGDHTNALQAGAAGQYDPGKAGGANQGPGIEDESTVNPWDLVLTLEGAVAWASGLYRRQGTSYRTVLCSPFTVRASKVGYGSASDDDEARAEIWTPLWRGAVGYPELKVLLREGRASVNGRPATNGIEFAEAARSLGVDRGIERFVRYSLLKRRGDSYVALPIGTFEAKFKSESELIRKFQVFFDALNRRDLPKGVEGHRRGVDAAVYNVLLRGRSAGIRELLAALGRMLRRLATTSDFRLPWRGLQADEWLEACDFAVPEVRIAASLASIYTREIGSLADNLSRGDKRFAWTGNNLSCKMVSVLERRMQLAASAEIAGNPFGGACVLHPGDAALFIEGSVDDGLIESLLFAFAAFDWEGFTQPATESTREVLPVYAVLKHLFLATEVRRGGESVRLRADPRVVSLLKAGNVEEAARIGVQRLRIAGLRPLDVSYRRGMAAERLAASLLIPVTARALGAGIFHDEEKENHELQFAG
jgi:CRISPR-associated protein Csx17